ncbi:MAG: hypothetical protein RL385_5226 [Pseudomonadota bacterium]
MLRRVAGSEQSGVTTNFDAIVLGAGISGMVSASILNMQGCKRVLVLDEYARVGGNHIDCAVGDYTFDIGSFIFQDDSPLLRHFPELLAGYVPIVPTFGRVNPQRIVTKYPFSIDDDLLAAGPLEVSRILLSVAYARVMHRRQTSARTFARFWIGQRLLTRSGLENYMRRFYGVEPEQIDVGFAHKRMLWIKEHAQVSTHVNRFFRPLGPATNRQLARPREGFAQLYQPAVDRLKAAGVKFGLGAKLQRIEKSIGRFQVLTDRGAFEASRIVSTIPIPHAQALVGLESGTPLKTVTLISLFYSFDGHRNFPHSVLFNFSHAGAWKRLTMHSDFYGRSNGREFFAVEVNAGPECATAEAAAKDFREHTAVNGIFDGDLRLEGHHVLSNAYPIYTSGAAEHASSSIEGLRAFGIESFGRQGGFDYQPTARVSTIEAEQRPHAGA